MKICIINNIYPPYQRGGAEQVIVKMADGLRQAGHSVVIITSSPAGDYTEKMPDFKIYRLHPRNLYFYTKGHEHNFLRRLIWHFIDIFNFLIAKKVKKILTEEKPDIVHTHNLMGLSFLIPQIIRKLKLKHIHTVHDVQLVEPSGLILKQKENSWRYNGLPTKIYTYMMKKLMGSPEVVISPSQFLLGFYEKRGFFAKSNFVVLRNPLTFEFKNNIEETEKNDDFNFLYLGQVEEHKGVLFLVDSFKDLVEKNNLNCVLQIAGVGSQFEELKKIAGNCAKIKILGKKNREELPILFYNTDLTIVPSLCYENSPTVIFESLSFGVPVIASRIDGIAELIQENENGLTFTAGDKIDLQEKIKWCLEHKSQIKEMGDKARASVNGLSLNEYISKLFQLYQN